MSTRSLSRNRNAKCFGVSFDGLKAKYRRIAIESRQEMKAEIGNLHAEDIQVDYLLREGQPERVIAETAGKLAIDLIVICTDGRNNIKDFVTGTITEHVINHVACPVLVIPSKTGLILARVMDALQNAH